MQLRYARHTNNLNPLIQFYTEIIGLEILGCFENHDNYNGIFLGHDQHDWHLEFTQSNEPVKHRPDPDDLLVFYVNSSEEQNAMQRDALKAGSKTVKSKNPYWQTNGIEITDPDGFGVIITQKEKKLDSTDDLTQLLRSKGILTWNDLLAYAKQIPYGRNTHRTVFEEVITENKGTCSTKHALAKHVADLNNMTNVKLIMGMYKMEKANTPGIGDILQQNQLDYIPEAHCYLKINGKRIDITNPQSDFTKLENAILEETEIEPVQAGDFKVEYHKKFIQHWISSQNIGKPFEQVWQIREKCIKVLSHEK